MRKIFILFSFVILVISCNTITVKDIYEKENLPLEAEGLVDRIILYKGGNITLNIIDSLGKTTEVAVDTIFKKTIRKGDYFIKKKNSNKCIIERNDSIIYLDCYDIPKKYPRFFKAN